MKNILNNKYFRAFLLILPLLLNIFLILNINKVVGDRFINVLDSGILFTKIEVQKGFFTLWTENNFGFTNGLFGGINFFANLYSLILLNLNLSIKWMELIMHLIANTVIFYSSWYAFYLLQKRVFENKNSDHNNVFFPFIVAFFYSYNAFNTTFITGLFDIFFVLQILFPYLLYILITLLEKEINIKYILGLAFIIGLTINVVTFSFAVYLCLFLPFFFLKRNLLNIKNIWSFLLVFIIAFLLASPLIYSMIHAYTTSDPYATNAVSAGLTAYIFPPYGIMGIFQFFFNWVIPQLNVYSFLYFRSIYGLTSTYMIWILILTILIIYWRTIKNKRILLFLMLSLILGMFLSKGGQKPFEELNMLLYGLNPLFAIFRTPGSKFGLPIILILSALILYTLNVNKKKFLAILIVVTVFMQTWVFFNQINFTGEETVWWNKPLVKVSQDHKNLISFVNNDKRGGSVLFYPGLFSGSYDLKNGTKFSFQDILGKYVERPIIYPDMNELLSLARRITTKIVKDFDPKLVGDSSIRYIIVRQDFDSRLKNYKAEVNRTLKILNTKDYKKVFSSKLFTIFEVNDKYFKDLITIKTPKQEYTPTFKKIAPYHYVVSTKTKDILNNQVIFRNNYHPQWVILDLEKKGLKAKQVLVDNFANGWNIEMLDKKNKLDLNQDIELSIYFYPQKNLFLLSKISLVSLGIMVIAGLFLLIKRKKN